MKVFFKAMITVIGVLLLTLIIYCAYVSIASTRLASPAQIENTGSSDTEDFSGSSINIAVWNIGGGVSLPDFSDYTEGGEDTRGQSEDAVKENLEKILSLLSKSESSVFLLSEVDVGATRSFRLDEHAAITKHFNTMSAFSSALYRSAYIALPFSSPVGYMHNSLLTLSSFKVSRSERISLPVATELSLIRYLDADRAFSVCTLPLGKEFGDKDLVIYNISLSEGELLKSQLDCLFKDMAKHTENGDLVVCAGDFSTAYEDGLLEKDALPSGFTAVFPEKVTKRALFFTNSEDGIICDGFLISPGLSVSSLETANESFELSDHILLKLTLSIENNKK